METQHIAQDHEPEPGTPADHWLRPGTTLANRYLIQGVIGVGGMGAVYRARDLHFPNVVKPVAVKEMVNRATDSNVRATIVRNFEREANLLATLEHRAIPRIYDYFTPDERSYLVLEFINGKDLESMLNGMEGFLDEARVIAWAIELCEVLQYLHSHKPEPIIFRDMKPSNIMINLHDHVVLVDFGIAKPFQSGERGTMIGTEGYSPPEQYRGEATPQADIYSLGATMHHLLTKRDPRLEAPFSFGERPIRKINPNVSPELEAVIYQMLQYNPVDRMQSAEALKAALMGVAVKTGILPHLSSPATGKFMRGEVLTPVWSFECEDEVRGSPVYKNGMVLVGSYDNNLYALEAETGAFRWKYPSDGGIVSKPAVHDGNVYVGSEDHRLHVVSQVSGKLIWTYYTGGPVRSSPHIAEGHVFLGSDDSQVHAVNTQSARRVWQFDAGAPVRSTPVVDKESIYLGAESGDFYCLNFSGQTRWRFKAKRAVTSSPVIHQGVVYFTSVDATLYALDARSGWVLWRFRLGKASISTPCIAENLLFTGAVDGVIYCVDLNTAKEVWRFTTANQVTGSPTVYKDSLYCGSVDGSLYCLEYRTGRLRWKFQTGGPITGSPAASEDAVYIGSTDHRIYALLA